MVFIHVPRLDDARLAEVGAADDRPGFHVEQEDRAFSGQTELGTLDLHPDAKPFPVVCMPKNEGLRVVRPKVLRRCVIGLIDVMDQFIYIHSRSRFARRSGRVLWGEDGRLAAPALGSSLRASRFTDRLLIIQLYTALEINQVRTIRLYPYREKSSFYRKAATGRWQSTSRWAMRTRYRWIAAPCGRAGQPASPEGSGR